MVNGGAGGNVEAPEMKVCVDGADGEGSGSGWAGNKFVVEE
jgi:hypothetical protein